MYTILRQGDALPTVGVLQVLLNRGIASAKLDTDGVFGPKTKKAVQDFQRPRGLKPDGIVGKNTCALTPGTVTADSAQLALLTRHFGPYSSVELHGCRVGQRRDGRQMVQQLANIWNVPVSAALNTQYAGGASTFRFEGRVYTAFPGGLTLRKWSRALPAIAEMSVP